MGRWLPTEAEHEFAARGGLAGQVYAWGNEMHPHGETMANTFQGVFPVEDTGDDGHEGAPPVKQYPPNGYGLYDLTGNVWECTAPGSLDTHLCYAAWRSSYSSRASIGV